MLTLGPTATSLARAASADDLAQRMVGAIDAPRVALARVWLTDAAGNLVLAASAGVATGGGSYGRLDGTHSRFAPGSGKIGRIAETGESLVVRGLRGDEDWLTNPSWVARQGIRSFVGLPIVADREVLGVLVLFDREWRADTEVADLRLLTDVAAARLSALRERDALLARIHALESTLATPDARVTTRADLRQFERQTIETALLKSDGRVFGPRGAAVLLAMKPTTLASRMKALGIRRMR